jgi:hypothetical protein
MCLSVRGFLKNAKFPRDYLNMFKHDDGRSMTPDEARDCLMDELKNGHEVIPMSDKCGNPCEQPGCAGFEYHKEMGGCPGHETQTPA